MHQKIYTRALAYYFKEEYQNNKKDLSKVFLNMINEGNKITLNEYKKLTKLQEMFIKKINIIFKNVDFVVSSSTFSQAPAINDDEKKIFLLYGL